MFTVTVRHRLRPVYTGDDALSAWDAYDDALAGVYGDDDGCWLSDVDLLPAQAHSYAVYASLDNGVMASHAYGPVRLATV